MHSKESRGKKNRMKKATINLTILPDQKSMCTVMLLFVSFSIAIDSSVRCFGDVHSNFPFISLHSSDETFVQVAKTRVQVTTMVCSQMQKECKQLQESTCTVCTETPNCMTHTVPKAQSETSETHPMITVIIIEMRYQNALTRVSYLFSYIFIRITFG